MKVKQLSLIISNEPGVLASACTLLAKENINISALFLADTADFGVLRLIIKEWQRAKEIFVRAGFVVVENDVIAVNVSDVPGGLAQVLSVFAEHQINVEYMYGFAKSDGGAIQIIRPVDTDFALEHLKGSKISLVKMAEIFA